MRPDLAGFRDGLERKRAAFAETVVFLGPVEATWPVGTPLDPETLTPFDPTIQPVASARASAAVPANVSFQSNAVRFHESNENTAAGIRNTTHPMVILSSGAASATTGMTHFICRDGEYLIEAKRFDGVTGIDRFLVWGAMA